MADQVPIRADLDGSSLTGLAIFSSGETVGVAHGGTGLATVGSNQLLTGNGTSALTSESSLTFDGSLLAVGSTAQKAAEIYSSDPNPYLVIAAEAETQNDTAGIAFHATKGQSIGSANTIAQIVGKVVNSGGTLKGDMIFYTNGGDQEAERMRIDSAGDVGIGGTPSGWLANAQSRVLAIHNTDTTSGNSATELALSVAHSTSWNAISFTNGEKASSAAEGKILYDHNTNSLRLSTNATEHMRIDSAGYVGIGNTAPSSYMNSVHGLIIGDTGDATSEIAIATNTTGTAEINFTDTVDTTNQAQISYTHSSANFDFKTAQSGGLFKFSPDTGGSVLMQIGDASSNPRVGIGTTSPIGKLHVSQTTNGYYTARFDNNQMDGPTVWINHTGTTSTTNPVLAVSGAGTDALQVKSNGAFFLSRQGTGSGASDTGWYMVGAGGTLYGAAGSAVQYLSMFNTGTIQGFRYNDTYVGQVVISSGATSYQSASDYRLKENIVDLINATDRVAQLQPRRFNWKADPDVVTDGFIAHEVESIVPEAVDGTKDDRRTIKDVIAAADGTKIEKNVSEEDWEEGKTDTLYTAEDTIPDGKEIGDVKTAAKYPSDSTWEAEREVDWYQSMDNAKLVPVLTAAIQELTVRLEAAEAKITTLEAV